MNKITQDEINRLRAPFPLEAHSFREGNTTKDGKKTQWFCYVEKPEVETRLNEVFPGEWGSTQPVLTVMGNSVAATIGITIRGITRGNTGEDSNGQEKAKGATTDAFRRAAADWGVAKYVWEMELKIWTPSHEKNDWNARDAHERDALSQFKTWYQKKFANYKPSNISPLPSETHVEPPSSDLAASDHPDIATSAKTPAQRLGTPNGQRIGQAAGYKLGELKTRLLNEVYGGNTFHLEGSLQKLLDAGKLPLTLTLDEAFEVVKNRKEDVETDVPA